MRTHRYLISSSYLIILSLHCSYKIFTLAPSSFYLFLASSIVLAYVFPSTVVDSMTQTPMDYVLLSKAALTHLYLPRRQLYK